MKRSIIGGALVVAVTAAASAWAAIPGPNDVINACYLKNVGILRVIDAEAGKKCSSIETPVAWNAQGPRGDTGPQGPPGPPGQQGPPSPTNVRTRVEALVHPPFNAGSASFAATVECNPGERAVGGGVIKGAPGATIFLDTGLQVMESGPIVASDSGNAPAGGVTPTAWFTAVTQTGPDTTTRTFSFYAICVS